MRAIAAWTATWLALWALVASVVPRTPAIPDVALNNAVATERLLTDGAAGRTVLLGSSVIGQLPVSRIDPRALNLGLSAYGVATSVLLVDRSGRLPAVAVIETNELLAPPDSAYADSLLAAVPPAWARVRAVRFEFRPSTQAIATVVRVSRLVRDFQPEAGKRRAEQRLADEWAGARADTVGARVVARWVAARLRAWRAHGVRVVLLEMPQHPVLQGTDAKRAARLIVDEELPASEFERAHLGDRSWRTSDGRHLESEDAYAAARALLASLARP
jgi:hypothetical protein